MEQIIFPMPTISFFIRTGVLYCRVRLNGTTSEFSTKQKINSLFWNQTTQQYKGKDKSENNFIGMLINSITYNLKAKSLSDHKILTASQLISATKQTKTLVLLREIVEQYIDNCNRKPGTLRNHNIKLNNLMAFENNRGKYYPETFTLQVCNDFIEWFCARANTKNITTANRHVLFYRNALKWYRKRGNKFSSELFDFSGEKDKIKTPVFLSLEELSILRKQIFASSYISRIRDLFVFQCYTGLSYMDLWSHWEIRKDNFGTILIGSRGKNENPFWIPVENDVVLNLLAKYNNNMPRYHNNVYNRILKEIAAICGINKTITTHTARKTFATMMDSKGWTRETISKMLGHRSIKTTELYYLGESWERLENEMRKRKKAV